MARIVVVEPVKPGYRLRDFVACLVVLLIGAAFVQALRLRQSGATVDVPIAVYLGSVVVLGIVFALGSVVDRAARRFPSLIRPRRCPRFLLLGAPLAALALAFVDDGSRLWMLSQVDQIDRARPLLDEWRTVLMG